MRVLFTSPHRLPDPSNGAAASIGALLRALTSAGHRCEALTGGHSPDSLQPYRWPPPGVGGELAPGRLAGHGVGRATIGGVPHTILEGAPEWHGVRVAHELAWQALVEERLGAGERPDVVIATGRPSALQRLLPAAHAQHVPALLYVNTSRDDEDAAVLREADALFAPSRFLADRLEATYGVTVDVVRPLVDGPPPGRRAGRWVTMVNPSPVKGLALFCALAAAAATELPAARFLVVEGRWTASAAAEAGFPLDGLPNVDVLPHQDDLGEVFRRTSVLLYPSTWEEAYGRTVAEAQRAGVPVIASRRGGIPEALNGGGFLLEPEEGVAAWLEALAPLVTDPAARRRAERRARRAAATGSGDPEAAVELVARVAAAGVRAAGPPPPARARAAR